MDALDGGRPQWALVVGEPGIGKTRLLMELMAEATRRGHLVLVGRGAEFERELPFGVWIDALDQHLDPPRSGDAELTATLGAVFPALAGPRGAAPGLTGERYQLHRAVRTLLENMAQDRPLVIVLDDLHWADPASVELLAHLLRRPPAAPVLVAVALRTGQDPHDVAGAVEAAIRDDGGAAVWLSPLSRDEAGELIGASGGVLDRQFALTGGNPFYLQQLARVPAGPGADGGARADDVPPAVRAALSQEFAVLSPRALLLAQGAAVAGEPFDPELAGRAADLSADEVAAAVDELLAVDLIRRTDLPWRYRFRHPIVRRAVYDRCPESRRLAAHGKVAAALAASGAPLATRAHHVERSARVGDDEAAALLITAARHVADNAPATAVRWRQAALRLLPDEASDRRRELTEELAGTLLDIGRLREGRDRLLDALDQTSGGTAKARLVIACAAAEHFIGHHLAAERRLVEGLAELPAGPTVESTAMRLELAGSAAHRGLFALSRMRAQQAAEEAVRVRHPAMTAVASAVDAFGQACTAADGTADALCHATRLVDELSDEQLAGHVEALLYLANAAHWGEQWGVAERLFRRGLALARATRRGHLLIPQLAGLAHTLVALGRLSEAAEQSEAAVDAARLGGVPLLLAWALANQAWTVAAAGDLDQASGLGAEAVGLLDRMEGGLLPASVRGHLAAIHLEAGDPQHCVTQMQAAGAPDFPQFSSDRRLIWYAVLVQAELARGRRDAAEGWARRGVQHSTPVLPVASSVVTRARALLVLDDDPAEAASMALTAAAAAESRGARLEAARSRVVAGRALAAAGHRRRATDELRAAQAELAACGARLYAADAARELQGLGPASNAPDGLAALSRRESQVAELVAGGRTNRQIAAALFLSEKTVEGYLTQSFAKLGVRTRAELAELVGRSRAASRRTDRQGDPQGIPG